MTLSTVNRSFERIGIGELFIAAQPASTVFTSDSTIESFADDYFAQFYADGAARKALATGKKPWAALTAEGLKVKVKQNLIEVDPNSGPKHPVGVQDTDITFELAIIDITPTKLAELASCSTDELIAISAATGKAGRSNVVIGGQAELNSYVLMYRMPSKMVPGEFDHVLIPNATFTIDTDLDLNKKSVLQCKVKGQALQEPYGMVNANGVPEQLLYDIATAAAL